MEHAWKATTAGILSIIAGSFALLGTLRGLVGQGVMHSMRGHMFDFFQNFGDTLLIPFIILTAIIAILAIVGGIFTLKRKVWGLALAGSIAAIIGNFPLGIAAVILTTLSKNEFK